MFYILQTSLSLLTSHRRLNLSSSLLCSFEDIFTCRRFILCLQGATSHTPTAKAPGSREGSGEVRQLGRCSLEPRSGKTMDLKSQREEPEAGLWSDLCSGSLRTSVIHQCLPLPSSAELVVAVGTSGVSGEAVRCDSVGFLSSSPSWLHSSSSILSIVDSCCVSVWLQTQQKLCKTLIYIKTRLYFTLMIDRKCSKDNYLISVLYRTLNCLSLWHEFLHATLKSNPNTGNKVKRCTVSLCCQAESSIDLQY